jgi:hypothetical protein
VADYKVSVFWSSWSPQIQTRILRDVLVLQRLAVKHRCTLIIACDQLLRANVQALGVVASDDFGAPDMCRVYVVDSADIPTEVYERLPANGVEPVVVSINGPGGAGAGPLSVEEDPYAGVKFYKGVQRIQETMPLNKPAPPHTKGDELPFSPYL